MKAPAEGGAQEQAGAMKRMQVAATKAKLASEAASREYDLAKQRQRDNEVGLSVFSECFK